MKMQEPKRLEVTAELVAQRIETFIMDGVLKPGQVLPSERQLTQRLAVSRSALREGLQILRVRGLIETRHGKGSFVANLIDAAVSKPLEHLLQDWAPYFVLMGFAESWLSGVVITMFVVYRPDWVAAFDDARYLKNK